MSIKAKVVQWNEERGFGFATSDGTRYFVHKTALGWTERAPRVGDVITIYQRSNGPKGPRIEKGCLDGVPVRTYSRPKRRERHPLSHYLAAALVVAGTVFFTGRHIMDGIPRHGAFRDAPAAQLSQSQTTRDAVAKYICENGRLPSHYVDKATGMQMYERTTGQSFRRWNFNPWTTLGVMIGGDYFENRKGLLPGDYYREADVDYFGDNRGTNRLVYADGCEIWYTADHYQSFSRMNF